MECASPYGDQTWLVFSEIVLSTGQWIATLFELDVFNRIYFLSVNHSLFSSLWKPAWISKYANHLNEQMSNILNLERKNMQVRTGVDPLQAYRVEWGHLMTQYSTQGRVMMTRYRVVQGQSMRVVQGCARTVSESRAGLCKDSQWESCRVVQGQWMRVVQGRVRTVNESRAGLSEDWWWHGTRTSTINTNFK